MQVVSGFLTSVLTFTSFYDFKDERVQVAEMKEPLTIWEQARAFTPGASNRMHFDNCGAALMPHTVIEAMQNHIDLEACVGGYVAQERVAEKLDSLYALLADAFGGDVSDYALMAGAAEAWARLFYSVPLSPGDKIITAYSEYCSNYLAIDQRVRREGAELVVIGRDAAGGLDIEALEAAIDDRVKLIALTHVSSSSGEILPAKKVGEIARKHNVLYLLDACQSAGQVVIDFHDIGCNMATATSRKWLRGPRGVGFLFVDATARSRLDPVMLSNNSGVWAGMDEINLRRDARIHESWERNIAAHMGLLVALQQYLALGKETVAERLSERARATRHAIYSLPQVEPACPPGADGAIISFNLQGWTATQLKSFLEERGIAVQVASVVHTRLDLADRGIESAVRVSPHAYTSDADIEGLIEGLLLAVAETGDAQDL